MGGHVLTVKRKMEILSRYQEIAAGARILNDDSTDGHIGYFIGTFPVYKNENPQEIIAALQQLCMELDIPLKQHELQSASYYKRLARSQAGVIEATFSSTAKFNPELDYKVSTHIKELRDQAGLGTPCEKATLALLGMASSIHTRNLSQADMRTTITRLLEQGANLSVEDEYHSSLHESAKLAENWEFIACLKSVAAERGVTWPPMTDLASAPSSKTHSL